MKHKYNGTDERVFPSLGITVKPGEEFDAPDGFSHPDCIPAGSKPAAIPTPPTKLSAASDLNSKESE